MPRHLVSIGAILVGSGAMAAVLLAGRRGVTRAEEEPPAPPPVAAAPAEPAAKPASGFFFSPVFPPSPEPEQGVSKGAAPRAAEPAPQARVRPGAFFYGGVPEGYGPYSEAANPGVADVAVPQQYSAAPASTGRPALNLFSIVGVPNNSGEILWPLGFRLLPDTQKTHRLLLQTNSQFLAAMGQQSTQARPDPAVLRALRQSLAQLRFTLAQSDATLGHGIYSEARDFLNRLDQAVTLLAQER